MNSLRTCRRQLYASSGSQCLLTRSNPHHVTAARRSGIASLANFKAPKIDNEPNKHYEKASADREKLTAAVKAIRSRGPVEVPIVIGGKEIRTDNISGQPFPMYHRENIALYSNASAPHVQHAIDSALAAKKSWERMPFADRASIFLKAADLISGKYRYELMAATMMGQGKNAWQAEIDAAAELCDFLRFNVRYAQDLYSRQPSHHSPGVWNRVEYRPLEGFVYAISPFNFTAIAGNLPCAPALMGNVVLWKPSPSALASNHLLHTILLEAGLPPAVIQFLPGDDAASISSAALSSPDLAALHFTGSTPVFRSLSSQIHSSPPPSSPPYRSFPRLVAETGGKNFHLLHPSADLPSAIAHTVRGAFEYQGQKCSATSRAYIPASLWPRASALLASQTAALRVGSPEDFANFCGPVIHRRSFERLRAVIDAAREDPSLELLVGGEYDDAEGFYVSPTVYVTPDPAHPLLGQELFGPVCVVHVYDDSRAGAFGGICEMIDRTSEYALTGAVFARERGAVVEAGEALRHAAGNFYVNCKSTGAVVGQQPFGGGRASGTNDKAGSVGHLSRFVSVRAIKEEFGGLGGVLYPSNLV